MPLLSKIQVSKTNIFKHSSLLQVGAVVTDIKGDFYRVASKTSGPEGFNFRLADLQGKPVQTPANFHPVSPAMAVTAAWMRFVFAYNADFDKYVKAYIQEAGLPVDPKMNWAKWFQYTYAPKLSGITKDPDVVDEAIHQVIITALAKRKDLTKFDAKRLPAGAQAQPLAEQVTTYLQWLFKKRVSEAYEFIKEKLQPSEEVSMYQPGDEQSEGATEHNLLDTEEHASPGGQGGVDEATDFSRLRDQFAAWLSEDETPNEIKKLLVLYDFFTQNVGRKLKISDYEEHWKQQTGLGFDSLKPVYAKFMGYIPEFLVSAGMISADKAKARGMSQRSSLASLTLAAAEEITSDEQVIPAPQTAEAGPANTELQENSHPENGGSPVLDGDIKSPERPNVNAVREVLETQKEMEVGKPIDQKAEELEAEGDTSKSVDVSSGKATIVININASEKCHICKGPMTSGHCSDPECASFKTGANANCECGHHRTYHDGKNKMCHGGTKDNPCNCDGRFRKSKAAGDQDAVERTGDKEVDFNPKANEDEHCTECGHLTYLHKSPYGCEADLGDVPGGEAGPAFARGECGCKHGVKTSSGCSHTTDGAWCGRCDLMKNGADDTGRKCEACGGNFTPQHDDNRFCSKECARKTASGSDDTGRILHNPSGGGANTGPNDPIVVDERVLGDPNWLEDKEKNLVATEKTAGPLHPITPQPPVPAAPTVKQYGTPSGEKKDVDVIPGDSGDDAPDSGSGYQQLPRRKTIMPELPNAEMILQLNASKEGSMKTAGAPCPSCGTSTQNDKLGVLRCYTPGCDMEGLTSTVEQPIDKKSDGASPNGYTEEEANRLLAMIGHGDRVTVMIPAGMGRNGQEWSQAVGKAVMRNDYGWALNMGGPHGRPGVATARNIVSVRKAKSSATTEPKAGAIMATLSERRAGLREKIAARRKERATEKKAGAFDLTNSPGNYSQGVPSGQGPDDEEMEYVGHGPFHGSLVKYDNEDFVALINSRYGWAVAGQAESILDGGDPEDQNSNALQYIYEFAKRKGETELAEYLAGYFKLIGKTSSKKYARLKQVAAEESNDAAEGLEQLAEAFGHLGDAVQTLRENLDLVEAPKEANLHERIASRRAFAKTFRRIAEEAPEAMEQAIGEVYQQLDGVAEALENYAENLGITLAPTGEVVETPGGADAGIILPKPVNEDEIEVLEEQEVAKDIIEEAGEEGESPAMELEEKATDPEHELDQKLDKEATSGADAFSSDRDHDGKPKEATSGSDNFVSDRDDKGEPKTPFRVEVPRLAGVLNRAVAAKRAKQIVAAAEAAAAPHRKG